MKRNLFNYFLTILTVGATVGWSGFADLQEVPFGKAHGNFDSRMWNVHNPNRELRLLERSLVEASGNSGALSIIELRRELPDRFEVAVRFDFLNWGRPVNNQGSASLMIALGRSGDMLNVRRNTTPNQDYFEFARFTGTGQFIEGQNIPANQIQGSRVVFRITSDGRRIRGRVEDAGVRA